MVKHIILGKLNDSLTPEEKETVKADMKANLEGLVGKIDGLTKMEILTDSLASSSADVMMNSEFTDEDALKAYQVHPDHQQVANTYVRPNAEIRLSMDYEV